MMFYLKKKSSISKFCLVCSNNIHVFHKLRYKFNYAPLQEKVSAVLFHFCELYFLSKSNPTTGLVAFGVLVG
jgi:hypothetical protein